MKPKIAALITASGGIGSHFILHKLQGHKNIVALQEISFRNGNFKSGTLFNCDNWEGTTKGSLKQYLTQGYLDKRLIQNEQLQPSKDVSKDDIEWLIINKPPLKMIDYHRPFHPDMPVLYIFRNPVSFYYTWIRKWKEYGERRYGRTLTDEQVFSWFKSTFMSSLFELAQNFNPNRDNIISFEHFFNDVDGELQRIFNCLGVENIKSENLDTMKICNVCGSEKVERKKLSVRPGRNNEEVLYCHRHGPVLGPGEYNYIRKEDPSFLNKWKENPDAKTISKRFEDIFGQELISYFSEESYLQDKDRSEYDLLMKDFLWGLKV